MTDTVVSAGLTSTGQFVGFGDTLSALSGGSVKDSFFTDNASITIFNGGSATNDDVTDFAVEAVDGVDASSLVANGGTILINDDGLGLSLEVGAGGELEVFGNPTPVANSGLASSTLIEAGGLMVVGNDGLAAGTEISGGKLIVQAGDATQTTLLGGLELVANAGSTESGSIVSSGGVQQVVSSGLIEATTVFFGGSAVAETGGLIGGATVSSGGVMIERFGGVSSDSLISTGALELVSSGGVSIDTEILGEQIVLSGGVASATNSSVAIESGGLQLVSGGEARFINVSSGGVERVVSSGVSLSAFVFSGGSAVAETGGLLQGDGTTDGFQVFAGGSTIERFFGSALAVVVDVGATDTVDPYGIAISAQVAGLQALSGGVASATTVLSGGAQAIRSGGIASGTHVQSGGTEVVSAGGTALGAVVARGGADKVNSGGIAISAQVAGLQVLSGGTTSGTEVGSGGKQVISAGGVASGTLVNSGGTEVVSSGGTIQGASVGSGGTLLVEGGATVRGAVTGAAGGTLELNASGLLTGLAGGNVTVSGALTAPETFADFGKILIDGPASFTLGGSAIVGVGRSLVVHGVLTTAGTLTVAGSLTVGGSSTGARALQGTGTLALTGGTTLFGAGGQLNLAHVTQAGVAAVTIGEALTFAGTWTQTKGTITVTPGHVMTLAGTGDRFSGTLAGGGRVVFAGGSDLLSRTTLSVATTVTGATVTLAGALDLTKTMTVTSTDLTIAAAGATLSGFGTLTLTNKATNKIVGVTAGATLTNASDTIMGAGQLGGGSMTLINGVGGSIEGNGTVALVIDTGVNTVTNAGGIISEGKGGVVIKSAIDNTGTLTVLSGTLTVSGAVTGAGSLDIQGGTANFRAGFSEDVLFGGASGTLILAKSQSYTGAITGFSHTGATLLDLGDIRLINGKTTATFVDGGSGTGGILTVTDGTHTAHIALVGDYTASTFEFSADGHGGLLIADPHKTDAAPAKPANVLPLITAMAGVDPGTAHWTPGTETGRWSPVLLAAAHPGAQAH